MSDSEETDRLAELSVEKTLVETQLATLRKLIKDSFPGFANWETAFNAAMSDIAETKKKTMSIEEENEKLLRAIKELENRASQQTSNFPNAEKKRLEAEIVRLEMKLDQEKRESKEMSLLVDKLTTEKGEFEEKLAELRKHSDDRHEIDALKKRVALDNDLREQMAKVNEVQTAEITALRAKLDDATSKLNDAAAKTSSDASKSSEEVTALRAKVAELTSKGSEETTTLRTKVTELTAELSRAAIAADESKAMYNELSDQLKKSKTGLLSARKEIEQLKGDNEKLRAEIERLKSEHDKHKTESERRKGEIDRLKGDLERRKIEVEKSKTEIAGLEKELVMSKETASKAQIAVREAQKEIQQLNSAAGAAQNAGAAAGVQPPLTQKGAKGGPQSLAQKKDSAAELAHANAALQEHLEQIASLQRKIKHLEDERMRHLHFQEAVGDENAVLRDILAREMGKDVLDNAVARVSQARGARNVLAEIADQGPWKGRYEELRDKEIRLSAFEANLLQQKQALMYQQQSAGAMHYDDSGSMHNQNLPSVSSTTMSSSPSSSPSQTPRGGSSSSPPKAGSFRFTSPLGQHSQQSQSQQSQSQQSQSQSQQQQHHSETPEHRPNHYPPHQSHHYLHPSDTSMSHDAAAHMSSNLNISANMSLLNTTAAGGGSNTPISVLDKQRLHFDKIEREKLRDHHRLEALVKSSQAEIDSLNLKIRGQQSRLVTLNRQIKQYKYMNQTGITSNDIKIFNFLKALAESLRKLVDTGSSVSAAGVSGSALAFKKTALNSANVMSPGSHSHQVILTQHESKISQLLGMLEEKYRPIFEIINSNLFSAKKRPATGARSAPGTTPRGGRRDMGTGDFGGGDDLDDYFAEFQDEDYVLGSSTGENQHDYSSKIARETSPMPRNVVDVATGYSPSRSQVVEEALVLDEYDLTMKRSHAMEDPRVFHLRTREELIHIIELKDDKIKNLNTYIRDLRRQIISEVPFTQGGDADANGSDPNSLHFNNAGRYGEQAMDFGSMLPLSHHGRAVSDHGMMSPRSSIMPADDDDDNAELQLNPAINVKITRIQDELYQVSWDDPNVYMDSGHPVQVSPGGSSSARRFALAFQIPGTGDWYKLPCSVPRHAFGLSWLGFYKQPDPSSPAREQHGIYHFRVKIISGSRQSPWSEVTTLDLINNESHSIPAPPRNVSPTKQPSSSASANAAATAAAAAQQRAEEQAYMRSKEFLHSLELKNAPSFPFTPAGMELAFQYYLDSKAATHQQQQQQQQQQQLMTPLSARGAPSASAMDALPQAPLTARTLRDPSPHSFRISASSQPVASPYGAPLSSSSASVAAAADASQRAPSPGRGPASIRHPSPGGAAVSAPATSGGVKSPFLISKPQPNPYGSSGSQTPRQVAPPLSSRGIKHGEGYSSYDGRSPAVAEPRSRKPGRSVSPNQRRWV